ADSDLPEQAAALAGQVVNGVESVLTYVSTIAQIHPIANIVVSAVKKVVELEKLRHENHAQIAQVHGSMVSAVYHLKVLVPVTHAEDDLKVHLETTFHSMERTIKEFGSLYHKCWQKIFKVLMATHHNKKLTEFNVRFDQHRVELDRVVSTRFTATTLRQLDTLVYNTQHIMQRLPHIDPDPELAAAETFVEVHGGAAAIIGDDQLLQELGEMLHERVTDPIKATLREDFEVLLQKNAERYEMKLQSVENNVIASMTASHAELARQVNAGPHELIDDDEIKTIWKTLHEHYQRKFHEHSVSSSSHHEDAWTTEYFSRMMYHTAIADIVDEDGSGFISISEMNAFCGKQGRRPGYWSVPQWFAFCASGWYNNNAWYYRAIKNMFKQIDQDIKQLATQSDAEAQHHQTLHDHHQPNHHQSSHHHHHHPHHHHHHDVVKTIVESLKPLLFIEDIEDVPELKSSHNLRRLQEDFRTQEVNNITKNLTKFGYHLEDQSAAVAIIGDSRVELHIMSVFYVFVMHLHHLLQARLRHQVTRIHDIEDLATSCMVVYLAFETRMHELMRGWRSQGRDIELQLGRYADGLFKNIHREAPKRKKALENLCKALFGGRPVPRRYRSMIESASHSPLSVRTWCPISLMVSSRLRW
ncbi:hypothetical protein C8Q76DRAFT_635502, partial [Earliella scabrosa]